MKKPPPISQLTDNQILIDNHILWIDVAKVVTMILVIIGHSTYYRIITDYGFIDYMPKGSCESFSYRLLCLITKFIYSFHMPFFMAISGMTMALTIGKSPGLKKFTAKKARRLLLPFLTVTIFLSIPMKYFSGYWDMSGNKIADIFVGQILLMGNSHLWFIVSLFTISIVFFIIHKLGLDKGLLYWGMVLLISITGKYISSHFEILSIGNAMHFYFVFALGFSLFEKINKCSLNLLSTLISWCLMAIAFVVQQNYLKNLFPGINLIIYYPMAIWGCFNMVLTAKLISKIPIIINNSIFRSLTKNSYNLYLYSDPFNYLLILIFSLWFGYGYVTDSLLSILAYLLRIIVSIILSYIVIWIVSSPFNLFKNCKSIVKIQIK